MIQSVITLFGVIGASILTGIIMFFITDRQIKRNEKQTKKFYYFKKFEEIGMLLSDNLTSVDMAVVKIKKGIISEFSPPMNELCWLVNLYANTMNNQMENISVAMETFSKNIKEISLDTDDKPASAGAKALNNICLSNAEKLSDKILDMLNYAKDDLHKLHQDMENGSHLY
jgi:hypothetical protein